MLRIESIGKDISSSSVSFSTNARPPLKVTSGAAPARAYFGSTAATLRRRAGRISIVSGDLGTLAWTPQRPAGLGPGMLAVLDYLDPVNEDMLHAGGILLRFIKGGVVTDCGRIEDNHIREHSFFEKTAMIEAEIRSRESAQPTDCFRKRNNFFVATIFSEHTGKVSISAWMRIGFQKDAFRRLGR